MKDKIHYVYLKFACLLWLKILTAACLGQSISPTAFTYQGTLTYNGMPVSGVYDFQFILQDQALNSNGVSTANQVVVTNGLFSVPLDFGAGAFPGDQRWLLISIRTNGASSYSKLSPTQPVSPNPYAIMSAGVANGSVSTAQLALGSVGALQMAHGAVGTVQITNGAVGSAQIANGAVGQAQIANGAVGPAQIANGAVGSSQLAPPLELAAFAELQYLPTVGSPPSWFGPPAVLYVTNTVGPPGSGRCPGLCPIEQPALFVGGYKALNAVGQSGESAWIASYGMAGDFYGPVRVNGTLTKPAGSFEIDHPLDPANKYLYHSFVESPDMKNIYDGVAVLDSNGEAVVDLPQWFEALNKDFRYQLTAIGAPGPNLYIAQKISGNRFRIAGGAPGLEVSWQVTGIRHDAYAEAHRIQVEVEKPIAERGYYLHPEEQGQPKEKSIQMVLHPQPGPSNR